MANGRVRHSLWHHRVDSRYGNWYLLRQQSSINVLGDDGNADSGLLELQKLGARSVPVVSRGDQWVSALSVASVIEFLDLNESAEPALSPEQLVSRLTHILECAVRYTRQFSDDQLTMKLSGRDRSYAQIAHHIFNIPVAFLDAVENDQTFTYESTVTPPPADMSGAASIADFGQTVRDRLEQWWDQSVHELLERTTWHSTQHVRQLISLLETLGTTPIRPLTAADLANLPLPEKVWD